MSSDNVLCTSAMLVNAVRPSRISLPYMCITMSLSSEWITPRPPCFASSWKTSQISPKSTIRPLRDGVMSVVKILIVAKPAWIASASWANSSGGNPPCSIMCWA